MLKEDVERELMREPFVPLRLHLKDGRRYDVPIREAARFNPVGIVVLIGVKPGTYQIKGYDRFSLDAIDRIEQRPKREKRKRRKAG
jgi:hypothetical protein